jgi:hypothetical protein
MLIKIVFLLAISITSFADTIDHFMNIANNIPQMEMKADPQSQSWARSARTVLILTSESIAETLLLANETASQQGAALFCVPNGTQLTGTNLNELIQQTYREISSQQSDKNSMTVSQVALLGLKKQYPCKQQAMANQSMAVVQRALTGRVD